VCLVPLGQIPPAQVDALVAYYRKQYGLTVTVLTPAAIPASLEDPLRQQIDASGLIDYMGGLFPAAYGDSNAVLIGLTVVDLYDSTSTFRYVFGVKGSVRDPKAVVSTLRMDPRFYSEAQDDELLASRARKLLSKYIGLLYYGLPPSSDPASPMFDSILGPADVDRMKEPLPVH
jgi:predicted Zn-dependent protease